MVIPNGFHEPLHGLNWLMTAYQLSHEFYGIATIERLLHLVYMYSVLFCCFVFVGSCVTVQCSEGHVCRVINGSPECICKPRCSSKMKQLGPFCGTDGRKYKNYCSLLHHNCVYQQQVETSYFGKCRSKQNILLNY